eukprot:TRINITY_DN1860_c1_g1_i1.p1 TRINITY_DN1860_c1_g1~~TRINITY_DN1860_c1_g1_i1.p1  ORF type:complete len:604 (+),score=146.51 TRINITY_DN1860_c1_g1_i1:104-1813(+)
MSPYSSLLLILLITLLSTQCLGTTFTDLGYLECKGGDDCDGSTFICGENRTCVINCLNVQSCARMTLQCGDNSICTALCSAENACSAMEIQCGAGAQCTAVCDEMGSCYKPSSTPPGTGGVIKYDCKARFSCVRRLTADHCESRDCTECTEDCLKTNDFSGHYFAQWVKLNFLNEFSAREMGVSNFILRADNVYQILLREPDSIDLLAKQDDITEVIRENLLDNSVTGVQAEYIHPRVVAITHPLEFFKKAVKDRFNAILTFAGDLAPFSITDVFWPLVPVDVRSELKLFIVTTDRAYMEIAQGYLLGELKDYFSVYFNINPAVFEVSISFDDEFTEKLNVTMLFPLRGTCDTPQPYYGVICVDNQWTSSLPVNPITFDELIAENSVNEGSIESERADIVVDNSDFVVADSFSSIDGSIELVNSNFNATTLSIENSIFSTQSSNVNIGGNFEFSPNSTLNTGDSSSTITVVGCANFDGDLVVSGSNETVGKEIQLLSYGCHQGEFKSVTVESEDGNEYCPTTEYRTSGLFMILTQSTSGCATSSSSLASPPILSLSILFAISAIVFRGF